MPAEGFPDRVAVASAACAARASLTLLAAPFRLLRALWQALRVMRRHGPRVVVGLGGFVTGPGGVAAWLTRRRW